MVPAAPRLALGITVGIPALTLGRSTVAGKLATHGHAGRPAEEKAMVTVRR
jgi:hypothetical protein